MASIEFDFNGEKINIPTKKETTMEQVLNIFEEKAGVNKNNLVFLYSGKKMNNYQLTFDQIANKLDKERNKMNIVVIEMENRKLIQILMIIIQIYLILHKIYQKLIMVLIY